jgi:hypothetical protein
MVKLATVKLATVKLARVKPAPRAAPAYGSSSVSQ